MQGIEGVEELLLGVLLALDELNVVHQDQIGGAVAIAEGLHAVLADGLDQVIGEGFGGDIGHPSPGVDFQPVMTNGLHQVGFAQAHTAADEQGVELPARCFGHSQSRRMGHPAVGADHKTAEHVAGIEPGQVAAWGAVPRWSRCRLLGRWRRRRICSG